MIPKITTPSDFYVLALSFQLCHRGDFALFLFFFCSHQVVDDSPIPPEAGIKKIIVSESAHPNPLASLSLSPQSTTTGLSSSLISTAQKLIGYQPETLQVRSSKITSHHIVAAVDSVLCDIHDPLSQLLSSLAKTQVVTT
jgi:hypothetical protein